jgi:hypothetical protein
MRWLLGVIATFVLAACASIGRPNGGEYDYDPPVFVKSNPVIGERNFNGNHVTVDFNENIQVEDVTTKVVVSPAQKNMPSIVANGHRLTVELRDTLIPNTTYTIDFSDAIRDLNESNVLDGFAVDFSTGDSLDSLRISGMVFEARTLEPAQGMLVGVYSNLSDTAITTLPMERIARTNQLGQFTIRGLRPGNYRIFAINDVNRDYHWDRSEDIAFYDSIITPWAEPVTVTDTLRTAAGNDSIVIRQSVEYYPNDILLTWFNEGYQSQYLKDYKRPERKKLTVNFGAHSDTLPEITLLNGPKAGTTDKEWSRLNTVATLDTLEYFLTDSAVYACDTMLVAMRYLRTDTASKLVWGTDTLKFNFKEPKKSKGQLKKEEKERQRKIDRVLNARQERGDTSTVIEPADTLELKFLKFSAVSGSKQELDQPLWFTSEQPLTVDTVPDSLVTFAIMRDTVWDTIPAPKIYRPDSLKLLRYRAEYKWEPGMKYKLSIDSAALYSVYGMWNTKFDVEFAAKSLEEYSALFVNVPAVRDSAYVEVLSRDDNPVAIAPIIKGVAEFNYLNPGDYYLRMFIDRNGNGEYDTGNLLDSIQPEEVYYYPKKITLKQNWDVEQNWNIYDTAIDLQKTAAIKKNKPKETKQRRRRADGSYIDDGRDNNGENYEEEDDGYGDNNNFFGPGTANGTRNIGNSGLNGFSRGY